MPKYICVGCDQPIREGFVAVLEGENPLYLHFRDNVCIDLYKQASGKTFLVPRILPFSDLEQTTINSLI